MECSIQNLDDILRRYGDGANGALMSILEDIQAQYRYLPRDALILVSDWTGIPLSQVYSVATFYHAFSLKRRGRHLINVCLGTACHVRGARQILDRLETRLKIHPGETTRDHQVSLETVNCLGACALGPIAVVDGEYNGQMTSSRVDRLLKRLGIDGREAGEPGAREMDHEA